ncbi:MAG: cysteine dioxygenase family protein [Bacteroidota bacterium]
MTYSNQIIHTLAELANVTEAYLQKHRATSIYELSPQLSTYQGSDWKSYVRYDSECYTRNYVVRQEAFEILVLCWQPGQGSPIHNHPHQGCLLKILDGSLTENRYAQNQVLESQLHRGDISYIDDQMGFHRIHNNGKTPAISLHIYAPGFFLPKIGSCLEDF